MTRDEPNAVERPRTLFGFLLALCLVTHPSSLVPVSAQPTFWERKEGYYQARGVGVTAAWSADRTELPEGEALTATLTVRNVQNPREVVRPDLRKLPDFNDRFQIEDLPGPPPAADAKEVRFAYQLRPRSREVDRLPSLDFFYLNPRIKDADPFMNARAKGLALAVTAAAPKPRPPAVPLDAPEHLLVIATGPELLDRGPFVPSAGAWLLAFALGPVAAVGWYFAWRRLYPDAARLARLRRRRAARRAIDAARRAHRTPDPAGTVAAAVLGYLRTRFPLPPGAETPADVGAGLREAGLPEPEAEEVVAFFRRCDAARFGPPGDNAVSLASAAESLVERLEAAG